MYPLADVEACSSSANAFHMPNTDDAGAAGRIDDGIGQPPAELLGQLDPHRFLALGAIRLLECRDVEPVVLLLPTQRTTSVVDQSLDEGEVGAVDPAFSLCHLRRVFGHEDVRREPGA